MPANTSHFDLFGFPRSFDIDTGRLDRVFRELQRNLHPDRYAGASDYERRLSVQQAARINEAYQTLKDPLARARYVLELHGHPQGDEHRTTRDTDFLMEQMSLRESLAEVREASDPLEAVAGIISGIGRSIDALTGELRNLLATNDSGGLAGSVDDAMDAVLKMTFFRRLQQEALALEAELEDELL